VMQMLRFPSFNVAMLSFCPEGLTSPWRKFMSGPMQSDSQVGC
jgi:hypothetical protein